MAQYTLGSGKLLFNRFPNPAVLTGEGERELGNTPAFNLNASSTTLEHFSADEGLRVKDAEVLLSLTRSGTFTVDEISGDNIAMFLSGTRSLQSQAAVTAPTGTSTIPAVKQDRWYQLGVTVGNPSGLRELGTLVVKNDAGSPVTYADNIDYVKDLVRGRIYIVPGGAIVDGTNLVPTYGVLARTRERIVTDSLTSVVGSLRFLSANPIGPKRDFFFPYVNLSPNGDMPLKGETWIEMPFNIAINKLNTVTEHIYIDGQAYTP